MIFKQRPLVFILCWIAAQDGPSPESRSRNCERRAFLCRLQHSEDVFPGIFSKHFALLLIHIKWSLLVETHEEFQAFVGLVLRATSRMDKAVNE